MRFDWPYYLEVAQDLTEQAAGAPPELQEAKYRAAISRAYYAVFGRARYHLRYIERRKEPAYINLHKHVTETFTDTPDDPDRQTIGFHLGLMRDDRNAADYDLHSEKLINIAYRAEANLKWAKKIFALLDLIQKK
jgi:uncharacterized protein (UPF0332 family)